MSALHLETWERPLLSLAYEARYSAVAPAATAVGDNELLDRAYAYCDAITATHSRTFSVATSLLPPDKRRAMRALYAFCRVSDDSVDCSKDGAEVALATWRQTALSAAPHAGDLIATAWADTRLRYRIPPRYAEQLLDGVARDLRQKRYRTFADVAAYAYGVASTVGLMSMHIIGFSSAAATLLDFRTPQQKQIRFFYVLPFSERQALVEYVVHTAVSCKREERERMLQTYLETVLGLTDYHILAEEHGVNPLTDQPFPRRAGRHIMTIGTLGGRVKPSTGYAFLRIQQDSAAIVQSLLRVGHPFSIPSDSRRYRLYDSLMLQIMSHHSERIKPIFTALFKKNPIQRIFRFLDETAPLWENLVLIPSLPPALFLQALFRLEVLRRV
jgi:hypothetical protein